MKKNFIFLLLIGILVSSSAYAQNDFDADQNPNAFKSKERYLAKSDSLLQYQGATIQQTYKAYDWYEAKQERRALRRERRHLERMANPYAYDQWFYPSIGFNYYWGGNNNWRWHPYVGLSTGRFGWTY